MSSHALDALDVVGAFDVVGAVDAVGAVDVVGAFAVLRADLPDDFRFELDLGILVRVPKWKWGVTSEE